MPNNAHLVTGLYVDDDIQGQLRNLVEELEVEDRNDLISEQTKLVHPDSDFYTLTDILWKMWVEIKTHSH